jgi:hypothetical protein
VHQKKKISFYCNTCLKQSNASNGFVQVSTNALFLHCGIVHRFHGPQFCNFSKCLYIPSNNLRCFDNIKLDFCVLSNEADVLVVQMLEL